MSITIGVQVIFYAFMIYLTSNSLIHLKVYFIPLQITSNPISLASFSFKVAWKEFGKIRRVERVSNANHKANSLAVQYCSKKKSFILGITTVTATSNQQNPHLEASIGLSWYSGMLTHGIRRVYVLGAVRSAGRGFNLCCTQAGKLWITMQPLTSAAETACTPLWNEAVSGTRRA